MANGGRGIPAFVSIPPPQAPSQPTTTGRFRPRPISTGGPPKGYKRRVSQNAVAGPSRQGDEEQDRAPYLAQGRAPFPPSNSDVQPEGSAAGPSHTSSPRKRARTEDSVVSPNKKARQFDESVISFSFLYLALLLTCFPV